MNAVLRGFRVAPQEARAGAVEFRGGYMSDRFGALPAPLVELAGLVLAIRALIEDEDEGEEGQVALACAIVNRMRRFGHGGGGEGGCPLYVGWAGGEVEMTRLTPADPTLYRALAVACLVLSGDIDDPTDGATHFHRHTENPQWAQGMTPKALIGRHFFYALPGVQ